MAALPGLLGGALFVLGLILGSFANVLIARLPEGESIAWPGSRCPHCKTPIRWYDNLPLLSWLILRGKCRSCHAAISLRYPVVELIMGLLFLAAYRALGPGLPLGAALALIFFLVPLTWIDLEHWLLPFELTLPGIAAGLLLAVPMGLGHLRDSALGAAGGFVLFWAMEHVGRLAFKKEALGAGDKYLLALLGAFLTYRALLPVVLFSSFQGSVVGIVLLATRGRAGPAPKAPAEPEPRPEPPVPGEGGKEAPPAGEDEEDDWVPGPTNIPFGPWLAISGLELLLLGPWIAAVLPEPLGQLLFGASGSGASP